MILGPADANHFRVKVGRYGDRWYADPLPADDIATDATDDVWPSFSTVKKASGSDWSFVAMKRLANADKAELERLPALPVEQRYDTCKSINDHGLKVAAGRGTILHWWGEDMLHGRPPRDVTPLELVAHKIPAESLDHAKRYLPAFRDFFEVYQPELVAAEYVAIHRWLNGVGYGCTPDGLWIIGGEMYAFDYKSRTEDGDHAAYPEEGAQIAAGTHAEYMIVEGDTGAERRPLPAVTAGMVVSLKPDGVRIYPVDLDLGFKHYTAMHAWWCARRDEREPIGRPWPVKKKGAASSAPTSTSSTTSTTLPTPSTTSTESMPTLDATKTPSSSISSEPSPSITPTPSPSSSTPSTLDTSSQHSAAPAGASTPSTRDALVSRAKALVDAGHGLRLSYAWPEGTPGFKTDHTHSDAELEAIREAIHGVEVEQDMPFNEDDMTRESPRHQLVQGAGVSSQPLPPAAEPPPAHPVDEGDFISEASYAAIKARFNALPAEQQFRLEAITAQANKAGLSISLVQMPTVRRFEITRALIFCCEAGWDDEEIGELSACVRDLSVARTTPLGEIVGALTIAEASALAEMADTADTSTTTKDHEHV